MPPIASVIILVQRNAQQAVTALRSLEVSTVPGEQFETIVLLNGADDRTIAGVQRGAGRANVFVSPANLGFGGGCNWGARRARGTYLVFLNDDVIVDPAWLAALIATADESESIGAVGSRIRFPDGTLQEAGSILWSDGSTAPIGRGARAAGPDWRFRRDVTYASACALLVRRSDFEAIGGFDEAYFPAYYEDVDLCLALAARGKRVVYEPRAELVHLESQSSSSDFKSYLFRRNHRRLTRKWSAALISFERPAPADPVAVERAIQRARGPRTQVLVIDDRLPEPGLGSGYGRTVELVSDLATPEFSVRMIATNDVNPNPVTLGAQGIEVIRRDLADELRDPARSYAVAIVSRPHNYERVAPLIREHMPSCRICYDVESLFYRRLEKQAELERDPAQRALLAKEAAAGKALESAIARDADRLVCISEEERLALEAIDGHAPIDFMLPLARGIEPTPRSFREREPLVVFVAGWMAGANSPNADGFRWFCDNVVAAIRDGAPHASVVVTGGSPPPNVRAYESAFVRFSGYVADLDGLYARSRVAISPVLFGAGVKIKTIESLQYGVPIVSTSVGAEGIAFDVPDAIDITDDPAKFARDVVALLRDEAAWTERRAAIERQLSAWSNRRSSSWADVCRAMLGSHAPPSRSARA